MNKSNVVLRFSKPILFLTVALCFAGAYSGYTMSSSVFPQTDFPRVVILIDNGVMPADEMMATVTRPIEESMKDIPGTISIRSTTGRGSAAVNVFFDWSTDMTNAEQYVLGRLSQIQSSLPPTVKTQVQRLTFSAFPILGISLTSETRPETDLWETARYDIYPRFLRIRGVARIKLVGGRVPEFYVIVDPTKLGANNLSFSQVTLALADTNLLTSAGMHEENYQLYLTTVDNRVHSNTEIEEIIIAWVNQAPVRVRDVAKVQRGAAPQFNRVTADGKEAVLLNIYGQPGCNTVQIAQDLQDDLLALKQELPSDMKLAFFYDQSQFVREGVKSVWDAIILGLVLSVVVLFVFLRSWRATLVAAMVIPVTVLLTLIGMKLLGMSFNLMTLGGIAAVVGIVIDDAIVMVEAIYTKVERGSSPTDAVTGAIAEVGPALVGSTMTPVVVFIPLAFLDGVTGVFFRALATTMVIALLISLLLAITWTPVTGGLLIRAKKQTTKQYTDQGGPIMRGLIRGYAFVMRFLLRWSAVAMIGIVLVAAGGLWMYSQLESDFLPAQDEGAFVIDYFSRPGTSLTETNRMLMHVEEILHDVPEVESFSRRTGARLALAVAEPNAGDFLVKLKQDRQRSTADVIEEVRGKANAAEPALHFEFPGVLGDLIGDLTWSPNPVEIKIYSSDTELLKAKAAEIAQTIEKIPSVVDVNDGLVVAGFTRTYSNILPQLCQFALAITGCHQNPPAEHSSTQSPVSVQIATAELTTLRPTLDLVGTIIAIPERTAVISSQFGGWVSKLDVVESQSVQAGETLVELDPRSAKVMIQKAEAAVEGTSAAVARLKSGYLPEEIAGVKQDADNAAATVDALKNELNALKNLLDRNEISPVLYETKSKALASAEAAFASANEKVKLPEAGTRPELVAEAKGLLDAAKADLEQAKLTLDWCTITSPDDGIVTQLLARHGQFFDRAVPLATVIDLTEVFAQIRIPSVQFAKVRIGSAVKIELASFPDEVFHGEVSRISGQADPTTGNVIVFAKIKNPDLQLRPGLSCQTSISLPEIATALVIPVAAIGDNSGTPVVTRIQDGKALETVVQLGTETLELVQITEGLSEGDVVATSGGYGLPDGCPVQILESANDNSAAKPNAEEAGY